MHTNWQVRLCYPMRKQRQHQIQKDGKKWWRTVRRVTIYVKRYQENDLNCTCLMIGTTHVKEHMGLKDNASMTDLEVSSSN